MKKESWRGERKVESEERIEQNFTSEGNLNSKNKNPTGFPFLFLSSNFLDSLFSEPTSTEFSAHIWFAENL